MNITVHVISKLKYIWLEYDYYYNDHKKIRQIRLLGTKIVLNVSRKMLIIPQAHIFDNCAIQS